MKNFIDHFEEYFVALLLATMTALTGINVFFRYVLESSIDWVFEFNTFLFAALIFLGASWGMRIGAHIGVDAVVKLLSPKAQRRTSCPTATTMPAISRPGMSDAPAGAG